MTGLEIIAWARKRCEAAGYPPTPAQILKFVALWKDILTSKKFIVTGFSYGRSMFVICDDGTLWEADWKDDVIHWQRVPGPQEGEDASDN